MVRVWVAGKTVCSPCYTRDISERFGDKGLIIKRYVNLPVYYTLLNVVVRDILSMGYLRDYWDYTAKS